MDLVKNIGSTLFFIFIYIFCWLALVLLKIAIYVFPKLENLRLKLQSWLMWNATINFIIQQFTPIMMSSLLNLYDLNWDSKVTIFSSTLSIGLIILISISIISFSRVLWKGFKDEGFIESEEFEIKFSALVQGLDLSN